MPDFLERCINQRITSKVTPNLEALCLHFGWLPIERIKKTTQATAQFTRTAPGCPFCKHCRTRWPAADVVDRWNEDVTADAFFSNAPLSTMTAFLDIPVAPWSRFMLESKAPNLLPTA
jgi:hypothetical protein